MKTILTSIASTVAYRNFFLLPGGVLDQLAKLPDIRIIIILKKGLPSTLPVQGANIVMHEVEHDPTRSMFQNLVMFFCSFFIFTHTTRLVSSYGVRSDKPRPLYKYWNYPFKWLISKTFGTSRWARDVLAPALYLWAFRGDRRFKKVFDTYKPDLVFVPECCLWPRDVDVLAEAKRRKIPTIGMPGNWDHLSKYFIPFKPDHLLVWSESVKEEAVRYQYYRPDAVSVAGGPHLDYFMDPSKLMTHEEFLKKTGFPNGSKIILYASQGPYSLDGPDYVDMLLKWREAGVFAPHDVRIIIRPHPKALNENERYQQYRGDPRVYMDEVEGWSSIPNVENFMNILAHPDIVVTTYSTIATEAAIWDRPTVIAGFDGYKNRSIYQSVKRHKNFTHFRNVIATGGVWVTESPDEFKNAVKTYLDTPEKNARERRALLADVFGPTDRRSAERIVGHIQNMLGNRHGRE